MNNLDFNRKNTLVINKNGMGNADEKLTHTLIKTYLSILHDEDRIPAYICFYADGVFLVCKDSHILEELAALESKGSKIVSCKTCLVFHDLVDKVAVGSIGTMLDIIEIQHNSSKVITL